MSFLTSNEFYQVLIITGVVGCGCAWLTGRAIALTWRAVWHVAAAMVLIGFAIRFFHFALFEDPLLAPLTSATELLVLLATGLLAWRRTRARQMVEQYFWLYEPQGPLNWRHRHADTSQG